MEPLKDLSQLNKLTGSFLRRNVMTNCFLSAPEFERYISKEAAFYTVTGDALVFLLKRPSHDLIYYYIKEGGAPPVLAISRPMVMEIVLRDERQARASKLWQDRGFKVAARRERMELSDLTPAALGDSGVFTATELQREGIMALLDASFDHLTGCIPEMDELAAVISREEILCIEENAEVIALVQFRNDKAVSEIRHLAVKEGARGSGLAGQVVNRYKNQLAGSGKKLRLWVKTDNLPAKSFYEKHGYRCDGLISEVLIAAIDAEGRSNLNGTRQGTSGVPVG